MLARLRRIKYRWRTWCWGLLRRVLPREVTDRVEGATLRFRPRTDIGKSLYLTGAFEKKDLALIAAMLGAKRAPELRILDLGANIGVHSITLCRLLPQARVVAFEPSEGTRRLLEWNVRANGLEDRIAVEACAVSNKRGRAEFFEMDDDAYSSLKDTGRKTLAGRATVEVETLDHYVESRSLRQVDLVKIDVEGFETEVIEGALGMLAALKPDLFVEIYQGRNSNPDPARTIGLLTSLGYRAWVVDDGKLRPWARHEDRYYNYYFSLRDVASAPGSPGADGVGHDDPAAHLQRGIELQGMGRYDEAHASFREALRLRLRDEARPDAPPRPGPRVPVPDTTLVCVDCRNHELALSALRRSMAQCRFERALFLTDRPVDAPGIDVVLIPPIASIADYSRFMVKSLADHVRTGFALVVQYDGYVLAGARWEAAFQDYDYVGAPWGRPSRVGNGGFSLRSQKLLRALRDPRIEHNLVPEDLAICETYRSLLETEHGIRFAPPEVAARFSFETLTPPGPTLGFHGIAHLVRTVTMSDEEIAAYRPPPMITW
jgi:FkbM family methyltransferase